MIVAGMIGAGLVWGWLLVLLVARPPLRRPFLNLIAVAIFTSMFAWLIYTLSNTTMLIPFFAALIFAFIIHFAWRQRLRQAQ